MGAVLVLLLVILRRLYSMNIANKIYGLYRDKKITRAQVFKKFIMYRKHIDNVERAKREFMYLMNK